MLDPYVGYLSPIEYDQNGGSQCGILAAHRCNHNVGSLCGILSTHRGDQNYGSLSRIHPSIKMTITLDPYMGFLLPLEAIKIMDP